jgi:hypothetical protein
LIKSTAEDLAQFDWNFDGVPDKELVACCYWEYARESAFIRGTLLQYRDWWLAGGKWDKDTDDLDARLERIQSLGHPSDVFVRGCAFPPYIVRQSEHPEEPNYRHPDAPPITGSFPTPWQSLSEAERKFRAHIRSHVEQFQIVPVKLAHWFWAKEIARECQRAADKQHEQRKAWEQKYIHKDAKGNFVTEANAPAAPEFEPLRPRIRWGVRETLMVDIAWECFTNDEIVNYFRKWVKYARPKEIPKPDDKGRNKTRDWRVALERLGMMRLLHAWKLRDMPAKCPEAWKLYGKREWYKERKRADEMFHRLFPFLSKSERPLSWPTKGGRSR